MKYKNNDLKAKIPFLTFKILPISPNFKMPERANPDDAGLDVFATEELVLFPGQAKLAKLGFKAEFSPGFECQVRTRSGKALKESLIVLNAPGTIDASYRGEYGVILYNADLDAASQHTIRIEPGDKIAQLVFNEIEIPTLKIVTHLSNTDRGTGGFGSTGK